MKSEIESCVGNVTVQDIKLVQRHCTKQKACTATLYKTKLQYVQVSTKQGVTYSRRGVTWRFGVERLTKSKQRAYGFRLPSDGRKMRATSDQRRNVITTHHGEIRREQQPKAQGLKSNRTKRGQRFQMARPVWEDWWSERWLGRNSRE